MSNIFRELRMKQHDEDYEPKNECFPTGAKAGSLEKLFVIIERVKNGQPLFHPGDNPLLATIAEEFQKSIYVNAAYQETRKARKLRRKTNG